MYFRDNVLKRLVNVLRGGWSFNMKVRSTYLHVLHENAQVMAVSRNGQIYLQPRRAPQRVEGTSSKHELYSREDHKPLVVKTISFFSPILPKVVIDTLLKSDRCNFGVC